MTAWLPPLVRRPFRPGWCGVLLAAVAVLAGCAYPRVSVNVNPHRVTVVPGDRVTVTITTATRSCIPPEDDPDQPCVDITGEVFEYALQNVPGGVTSSIDTSLQSPSTPGVARITFEVDGTAVSGSTRSRSMPGSPVARWAVPCSACASCRGAGPTRQRRPRRSRPAGDTRWRPSPTARSAPGVTTTRASWVSEIA